MSQTHALTYWTDIERGTDAEHDKLVAVVQQFEEGLDKLFFSWLVDYRAYVMHGRLVFRCEVRARGRTAVAEESVSVHAALTACPAVPHLELQLQHLPLACVLKLAGRKTKECQA